VTDNVKGLLYGGSGQMYAQLLGAGAVIVLAFGASWVFFKVLDATLGIRVSPEEEIQGLDLPEIGVLAYPDFSIPDLASHGSSSELHHPGARPVTTSATEAVTP
jgi:Amt family ammonium transporter